MPKENIFIDGMMIKPPSEKAPDFIKGSISVKCKEFNEFMKAHQNEGWLNIDIKKSKGGKLYLALNTYRKKKETTDEEIVENIDTDEGIDPSNLPF